MTDLELEERVRATLRAVADATPADVPARRPSRRWLAVAVAAAVVVAGAGLAVLARDDDARRTTVDVAAPTSQPSPIPKGFDLHTAAPVFGSDGEPDEVADAYLRSRFPDFPAPGVTAEPAVVAGDTAAVRWSTGTTTEGQLAAGTLDLRLVDGRWSVVAATTDSVDLGDLTYDGERVRGHVRTTSGQTLRVEILDWRGDPVHQAPEPLTGDLSGVEVDVRHPSAPAVVRVTMVGGTVLSIAEVRFDPAPLAPHRDHAGCVEAHTTVEKEPTPDIVDRRCAAALDGDVIATGGGGEPAWELVATDEPDGHWVTLRWRDLIGTYRLQTDGDFDTPFTQLGPCCGLADHVAVVGTLRPGSTGLRVVTADATAYAAEGHVDPATGVVYAVALVPQRIVEADPSARVEIRTGDGTFVDAGIELSLAVLGG